MKIIQILYNFRITTRGNNDEEDVKQIFGIPFHNY